MAEEVTQAEAYTSLVADAFDRSYPNEGLARRLYPRAWKKRFDAQRNQE